jgi:type IV pilus assembly protein PilZ
MAKILSPLTPLKIYETIHDTMSTTPANLSPAAGSTRPSVIQLAIKEKVALYTAYIPLFVEGGIFIPTTREYNFGDDVYVLLSLPDDVQRYPVAGKVAWITPPKATGGRAQGVGITFPNDEKSKLLKNRIEEILGKYLTLDRPTQTM